MGERNDLLEQARVRALIRKAQERPGELTPEECQEVVDRFQTFARSFDALMNNDVFPRLTATFVGVAAALQRMAKVNPRSDIYKSWTELPRS